MPANISLAADNTTKVMANRISASANSDDTCSGVDASANSLANVDEIVATEGVDVIFIGPGDLSVSINAMGPAGAEKLNAAITTITKAARKAGKAVGIFRPSADDVGKWAEAGITFFILASDTMFLGASLAAGAATARKA